MSTPLSLIARKAEMAGLRAGLDAGGAAVLFYTGTPPAVPDAPTAAALLGTLPLASPCGALGEAGTAPVFATLSITVPQVVLASATGVIGWVRFVNGAGNGFIDLLAGLEGSGAPVIVNAVQVYTGGELRLVSCLIVK